jgi:hypothetical protein
MCHPERSEDLSSWREIPRFTRDDKGFGAAAVLRGRAHLGIVLEIGKTPNAARAKPVLPASGFRARK